MNAFLALIPVIFIRYVLLGIINSEALKRAAFFSEMIGFEKAAYWLYQISTILLFLYLIFLKIVFSPPLFYAGLVVYGLGIVVFAVSTYDFARSKNGLAAKGLYRLSRNPMYIGYFFSFLGCVLMTRSLILLCILIVFQVSAHWVIRAEERWCIGKFGKDYVTYMKNVRRYL